MASISPTEFMKIYYENASTRKKRSLEIINDICNEQHQRGSKDFSIPTISRLSVDAGGPSEQTIRNKGGSDYRALLDCWAKYVYGVTKKPNRKKRSLTDEILEEITDPTIRALVGVTFAENRKLKGENSLLKQNTELSIDMRPLKGPMVNTYDTKGSSPSLLTNNLLPSEIDALRHSISNEFLSNRGWTTDEQGRIKCKGQTIYKTGYVIAIKKILSCYSGDICK